MKIVKESIRSAFDDELLAKVTPFSDSVWVEGFFDQYSFEARVSDIACDNGINAGRVTHLYVLASYFTEDNSFESEIARYQGELFIRPSKESTRKRIDDLVAHLEKLPTHEAFEAKQKQTA